MINYFHNPKVIELTCTIQYTINIAIKSIDNVLICDEKAIASFELVKETFSSRVLLNNLKKRAVT